MRLLILLLLPTVLFAQNASKRSVKYADSSFFTTNQNIFRVAITEPTLPNYQTDFIVSGNCEKKISNQFSALVKLGCGSVFKKFGPPDNPYQSSYHLVTSLEARYFYSQKRRIRKYRPTYNFSGSYISLENNYISNPFALINLKAENTVKSNYNTFLNLGYQRQYQRLYLNMYFGLSIWGQSEYNTNNFQKAFQGGVGLGYVFK
jgi:hypothetical protein